MKSLLPCRNKWNRYTSTYVIKSEEAYTNNFENIEDGRRFRRTNLRSWTINCIVITCWDIARLWSFPAEKSSVQISKDTKIYINPGEVAIT
jgi:hypothetical protein